MKHSTVGLAMVAGLRSFCDALESGVPIESSFRVDAMRLVESREVAPNVYRVTTESDRYGRVTQNVLVLPGADDR